MNATNQWVEYHSRAWDALVEQGWITWVVEYRGGTRYALMTREHSHSDALRALRGEG